jgi:hypothetical protein
VDDEFEKQGYSVVRSAIAEDRRAILFDYISTVFGAWNTQKAML